MNNWYREYLKILESEQFPAAEPETAYNSLSDAGDYYKPGDTEIWYLKVGVNPININADNLYQTHAMIGTLTDTDPETILSMMQAESWDPDNRSSEMLDDLDVDHASMTAGDVIVTDKTAYIITKDGFTELGTEQ
jgi:hypothetical protein